MTENNININLLQHADCVSVFPVVSTKPAPVGVPVGEPDDMARGINLLTARKVATVSEPGRYADGGGLYLIVRDRGKGPEKIWLFRYKRGTRGRVTETAVSIGPARIVTLAAARAAAERARAALAAGNDPKPAIKPSLGVPTFAALADDLIDALEPGFGNEKHIEQWRMTLGDTYCRSIRSKPVDEIGTADILAVLKPIWQTKPETASRVRGRIERVLDSAKVQGHRSGENPARWRNHLSLLLPARHRLTRGHHRALAWKDAPAFLTQLRGLNSMSALALEWTILTAARTSETTGGLKAEVDRTSGVWRIPAARMKGKREHLVPLCDRCLAIYDETADLSGPWLFPAISNRAHLSNAAMSECLKGFGVDATVHGFRSTFRDWVNDATEFPESLAEAALAHVVGDKTEAAYKRGTAIERRRHVMQAWESYLLLSGAKVVALRR